jgi:hypothetical protein
MLNLFPSELHKELSSLSCTLKPQISKSDPGNPLLSLPLLILRVLETFLDFRVAPITHVFSNSGEEFEDIAFELSNARDRIIRKLPVAHLFTLRKADCFAAVQKHDKETV